MDLNLLDRAFSLKDTAPVSRAKTASPIFGHDFSVIPKEVQPSPVRQDKMDLSDQAFWIGSERL